MSFIFPKRYAECHFASIVMLSVAFLKVWSNVPIFYYKLSVAFSLCYPKFQYAECQYAECQYPECQYAECQYAECCCVKC